MKIKICGIRREEDIAFVNEVKPDYIGFILAPGFRRSVDFETAKKLRSMLHPHIAVVGVFVNDSEDRVVEALESGIIDIAQLHGEESEEGIMYIKAATGKEVIKVVRVSDRYIVQAWLDTSADYLLFDSGTGTGKTFDWDLVKDVDRDYFLAGGIDMENMEEAAKCLQPFAVDLSSSVETEGVKDFEKMKKAVEMAHRL